MSAFPLVALNLSLALVITETVFLTLLGQEVVESVLFEFAFVCKVALFTQETGACSGNEFCASPLLPEVVQTQFHLCGFSLRPQLQSQLILSFPSSFHLLQCFLVPFSLLALLSQFFFLQLQFAKTVFSCLDALLFS